MRSRVFPLAAVSFGLLNLHSNQSLCYEPKLFADPKTFATKSVHIKHSKSSHIPLSSSLGIITGTAHKELGEELAKLIGVKMIDSSVSTFADGEVSVQLNESVRDKEIFIVQTCAAPVYDSIMELLLLVSCVRRSGCNRIVAVIPYFGYKHHRRGTTVSTQHDSRYLTSGAVDFAKMLQEMGVDHVIAVDVQRPGQGQEACFFSNDVPLEVLLTTDLMTSYLLNLLPYSPHHVSTTPTPKNPDTTTTTADASLPTPPPSSIIILSPNEECLKKADRVRKGIAKEFPYLDVRLSSYLSPISGSGPVGNYMSSAELIGEAKFSGADVIIVDDMIDTAATLEILSNKLKELGARDIYACASHGVFNPPSLARLAACPIKKIVVTNSLPLPFNRKNWGENDELALESSLRQKIIQVSIGPMLANVIKAEHFSDLSELKEEEFVLED